MTEREVDRVVDTIRRKHRRSGIYQIVLAVILALLVIFGLKLYNDLNDEKRVSQARDVKIGALEAALDAQRAQFERCKDLPPTATGCAEPIAPSSGSIPGPEGPQGLQGIPGPIGPQGLQGPRGIQGLEGKKGDEGDTGATGATGPAGPEGPKGEKGDQGPKGDAGETGPQGPVGPAGPTCPDGYTGSDQVVLTQGGFQTVFMCVKNP